jgi:hypothetical protein
MIPAMLGPIVVAAHPFTAIIWYGVGCEWVYVERELLFYFIGTPLHWFKQRFHIVAIISRLFPVPSNTTIII